MTHLGTYVNAISVIGPGFADWPTAAAVLAGRAPYVPSPTVLPAPMTLPAAERRRTGRNVKLALAVGLEAIDRACLDATAVPTVFCSSSGDGDICHQNCQTLATADRQISPTRFHNSVQNAPAGYWSIATGAMVASTTLSAYDASFAAGLLEAMVQVTVQQRPVLLIACDTGYPPPLSEKRRMGDAFGIALVLAPNVGATSVAHLSAALDSAPVHRLDEPALEALRLDTPAGRGLPLLALLARRLGGRVAIEYLGETSLCLEVGPC
jgi:hypothetical protein